MKRDIEVEQKKRADSRDIFTEFASIPAEREREKTNQRTEKPRRQIFVYKTIIMSLKSTQH